MDTSARLSANLQRAYTEYKTHGHTPVVNSNLSQTPLLPVQCEGGPYVAKTFNAEKPSLTLPDISRPGSSYHLPPPLVRYDQTGSARRLARSEEVRGSRDCDDLVYEYQVDDAAGIPSLAFFKKSYSLPTNRNGRAGACWRHIQQCTAQGGSNLLYVDGNVKSTDCSKYPPFGLIKSNTKLNHLGQRLIAKGQLPTYNSKAKSGFEYWYKEPKANITEPPPAAVRTISGHQYKLKGK
ncbi:uncharacterized protein [Watersipora subatra]|uniref:uncharacterized protein n=1 Tax=Watersipora subatra TaxID=2589382 RepID=UPI00355C3161